MKRTAEILNAVAGQPAMKSNNETAGSPVAAHHRAIGRV